MRPGDEEAREHEEHVDPEEAARDPRVAGAADPGVVEDHRGDRESPEAVECRSPLECALP